MRCTPRGLIVAQLCHLGTERMDHPSCNPELPTRSPSGEWASGSLYGRAATIAELERIWDDFARPVLAGKDSGFDAIELHGAHGHLLDRFQWEGTNRRDDVYGGSLKSRTASPRRSPRLCAQPSAPTSHHLSLLPVEWGRLHGPHRQDPAELETILGALAEAGVFGLPRLDTPPLGDRVRGGRGSGWTTWSRWVVQEDHGIAIDRRGFGRPQSGLPHCVPGRRASLDDRTRAAPRTVRPCEVDLIAVGRVLLSNPSGSTKSESAASTRPVHSRPRTSRSSAEFAPCSSWLVRTPGGKRNCSQRPAVGGPFC